MLKVDLDRLLPSNPTIYLFTFMPGLFFLGAIAIGNPDLSSRLSRSLQVTIPFSNYASLFAVLFVAFVTGATFITLVTLIQHIVFAQGWRLWFSLKPILCKRVLLPIVNRLLATSAPTPNSPVPKRKPQWLCDFQRKTIRQAFPPPGRDGAAFLWWEALAKQLLNRRFGLQAGDLPHASIQPLSEVLTEPTLRELHGDLMFVALHATGWSALAAVYFAPELGTTWFYVFAFFLIGNGLYNDIMTVKFLSNPEIGDTLRLRAVLREFPKLKTQPASENHHADDTQKD